jgi:hypothetical protein
MNEECVSLRRYTQQRERCLCWGREPLEGASESVPRRAPVRGPLVGAQTHRVWVAFLQLENEEYEAEASLRTHCCLPMNKITVWLTQRPWIHCQLVLWDDERRTYYTFSVDSNRPVHVFERKEFQKGWDFLELRVSEACELRIYNFLVAQIGKRMNSSGQLMALFFPLDSGGERWFCSELVAAALEAGGIIDFAYWDGIDGPCGVVMHQLYDYLLTKGPAGPNCEVAKLAGNPVAVANIFKHLAQPGARIALQTDDGLPQSLANAAAISRHQYQLLQQQQKK